MRINDWSSDVCSSDLLEILELQIHLAAEHGRQRLADQRRRMHDGTRNSHPRRQYVVDGNGQRHGALYLAQRVHGAPPRLKLRRKELALTDNSAYGRSEERRVGKECVST